MSAPRVTAVITSYNYGRFVAEAIESVLAQGLPPTELEIVVVDDGSTDDTPERIRQFDGRITYVRKPNGGQASALNAGFANAHADIVALLDADDVWLPGKLHRVMAEFDAHPDAVMVQHTRLLCFTETGREERETDFPPVSGKYPMLPEDLLRCGITATSALAYRRSGLGALLPIPEILTGHADSYVSAIAVLKGPVISVNEPLARYRIHGGNLYSFQHGDQQRAERRLAQMETFVREVEREIAALRPSYPGAGLDAYLERFRLIELEHRFFTRGAGRLEFFLFLQRHSRVFGALWTPRYRLFRGALSLAALAFGYERFTGLRRRYRDSSLSIKLREDLFPAQVREAA